MRSKLTFERAESKCGALQLLTMLSRRFGEVSRAFELVMKPLGLSLIDS